ncbi:MAG: putative toxin-antitoxin system toxin component, PIN family [Thiotrichaceae bacterium]
MKVVIDTNILLSGLMSPNGIPGRIVQAWRDNCFELVLSQFQLDEIGRVLSYPKIQKRLGWDQIQIAQFLKQLFMRSNYLGEIPVVAVVPADTNDNLILSAYIIAEAEYLVTGDIGILDLREQYKILTAKEFVRLL